MAPVPPLVEEAEAFVSRLATELTQPHSGECLCCYLARQLAQFPCDSTRRHAVRYRDAVAPRATALAARLRQLGAGCDCEVFLNGYGLRTDSPDQEADGFIDEVPPCEGVRRGSLRPCSNWTRIRRW